MRLAGTTDLYRGRVEVNYAGIWGTVADRNWNIRNGHVICKQLGYKEAVAVYTEAKYGQGTGVVWLSDVNCTGTEQNISNCPHPGWGNANGSIVTHAMDASVECANSNNKPSKLWPFVAWP